MHGNQITITLTCKNQLTETSPWLSVVPLISFDWYTTLRVTIKRHYSIIIPCMLYTCTWKLFCNVHSQTSTCIHLFFSPRCFPIMWWWKMSLWASMRSCWEIFFFFFDGLSIGSNFVGVVEWTSVAALSRSSSRVISIAISWSIFFSRSRRSP